MDIQTELLESFKLMLDRKIQEFKADRTYRTVIKRIDRKGYVIPDLTGNERIVKCCIPNISLRAGQTVFVKEPMGDLQSIHICGVPEK